MLIGRKARVRKVEESDMETIYRWFQDVDFIRFYSPEELLITQTQLRDFLAHTVKSNSENSIRIDFILEDKEKKPVGLADLTAISHRSQHATFSIGIDKKYRNHEYGPEATVLILHFAYTELNLIKISVHIFKENIEVVRQLMRLGFQQEGVLRKEVFFDGSFHELVYLSILKEEFYQNPLVIKILKRLNLLNFTK